MPRPYRALILLFAAATAAQEADLTPEELRAAGRVAGLEFTDAELKEMVRGATQNLRSYALLRRFPSGNEVPPAPVFRPVGPRTPPSGLEDDPPALPEAERPADTLDLAFADIATLAALVRSRRVSCRELAELSLARLRRLDETLKCVVTLTEERALRQADALDREIAEGRWRGPLHGIPYGAKDLFAVKGYPTTWGAKPYAAQTIDADAAVVERLDAAGAVLVAKLSLGALAMGDVWFGGRTNNPWNVEQGSSGSSAGSAAAVAAGGVAFALGTETLGSIVSPSERCGCTSLRPTFGRVSRHGAMSLSWSMDKVGPLCRSAADAALVFRAIHGADPRDPASVDAPFAVAAPDVKGWRVGYLEGPGERVPEYRKVLEELKALGVVLVPADLPRYPVAAMRFLLMAEAAAAFDELTRDGLDDRLTRQDPAAWPNQLRTARLIPAVEYIQAQRMRTRLMEDFGKAWDGFDFLVHPSFLGDLLLTTNLTGHPTAVAPAGFRDDGTPYGMSFTGRLLWDDRLLALVAAWQRTTDHHRRRPPQ